MQRAGAPGAADRGGRRVLRRHVPGRRDADRDGGGLDFRNWTFLGRTAIAGDEAHCMRVLSAKTRSYRSTADRSRRRNSSLDERRNSPDSCKECKKPGPRRSGGCSPPRRSSASSRRSRPIRLTTLNLRSPMDIESRRLLVLNLAYWYVPAAADADDLPARRTVSASTAALAARARRPRCSALSASPLIHCAGMLGDRAACSGRLRRASRRSSSWTSFVQRLFLHEPRLGADDLFGHRRAELRARVLPRVAGARGQGGAARDAARRGAAAHARGRAASALPLQHAARDLDARAHAIRTPPTA